MFSLFSGATSVMMNMTMQRMTAMPANRLLHTMTHEANRNAEKLQQLLDDLRRNSPKNGQAPYNSSKSGWSSQRSRRSYSTIPSASLYGGGNTNNRNTSPHPQPLSRHSSLHSQLSMYRNASNTGSVRSFTGSVHGSGNEAPPNAVPSSVGASSRNPQSPRQSQRNSLRSSASLSRQASLASQSSSRSSSSSSYGSHCSHCPLSNNVTSGSKQFWSSLFVSPTHNATMAFETARARVQDLHNQLQMETYKQQQQQQQNQLRQMQASGGNNQALQNALAQLQQQQPATIPAFPTYPSIPKYDDSVVNSFIYNPQAAESGWR